MEGLLGNPFAGIFEEFAKITKHTLKGMEITTKIEELDPNVLSKNMIEKVSIIYGKDYNEITDEDIELINALYKINVEDKKNAE